MSSFFFPPPAFFVFFFNCSYYCTCVSSFSSSRSGDVATLFAKRNQIQVHLSNGSCLGRVVERVGEIRTRFFAAAIFSAFSFSSSAILLRDRGYWVEGSEVAVELSYGCCGELEYSVMPTCPHCGSTLTQTQTSHILNHSRTTNNYSTISLI